MFICTTSSSTTTAIISFVFLILFTTTIFYWRVQWSNNGSERDKQIECILHWIQNGDYIHLLLLFFYWLWLLLPKNSSQSELKREKKNLLKNCNQLNSSSLARTMSVPSKSCKNAIRTGNIYLCLVNLCSTRFKCQNRSQFFFVLRSLLLYTHPLLESASVHCALHLCRAAAFMFLLLLLLLYAQRLNRVYFTLFVVWIVYSPINVQGKIQMDTVKHDNNITASSKSKKANKNIN